jgi:hypothetical protein
MREARAAQQSRSALRCAVLQIAAFPPAKGPQGQNVPCPRRLNPLLLCLPSKCISECKVTHSSEEPSLCLTAC